MIKRIDECVGSNWQQSFLAYSQLFSSQSPIWNDLIEPEIVHTIKKQLSCRFLTRLDQRSSFKQQFIRHILMQGTDLQLIQTVSQIVHETDLYDNLKPDFLDCFFSLIDEIVESASKDFTLLFKDIQSQIEQKVYLLVDLTCYRFRKSKYGFSFRLI